MSHTVHDPATASQGLMRREVLQVLVVAFPWLTADQLLAVGRQAHGGAVEGRWLLFDGSERRALASAVDTILPATDTPAASDCGVVEFIDRMVAEWFPDEARGVFTASLGEWLSSVQERFGAPLPALDSETRTRALTAWHDEAVAERGGAGVATSPARLASQHPFDLLKWMTIWGYFTSETGMRQVRSWRAVPGRYRPDVPYP